ncbi:MAG: helix-hairpin-helix domain-containing protein [Ruminococcus sp.]|nr:helix-hairpin-helix domain-containing protein [Ruminococcus sp.]
MADKVKIITAVSSAIAAASVCVSLIVGGDRENDVTVVMMNRETEAVEFTSAEQVTSSATTTSASTVTTKATVSAAVSYTVTAAVSAAETTSAAELQTTEIPVISYETEIGDYGYDILYIDINTAEKEDFMRLKGIGDYLADEIISYRNEYGGFSNTEEIMNINGIGEKIFAGIADFIYVENPVYPDEEEIFEEIISDEPQEFIAEETMLTLESCIPININTADRDILMLLPNVDETAADEIIELRSRLGAYSNTYELLYLESLSQGQLAEIIDYLTV